MRDSTAEPCIAVVDDDRRVLESLGSLLESADYRVCLFDSATALLASGCLRNIACLISDIGMPVMDGYELLSAVQSRRAGLPVILITGQSNQLNQPPLAGLAPFGLLKKPFSAPALLAMVHDALSCGG